MSLAISGRATTSFGMLSLLGLFPGAFFIFSSFFFFGINLPFVFLWNIQISKYRIYYKRFLSPSLSHSPAFVVNRV